MARQAETGALRHAGCVGIVTMSETNESFLTRLNLRLRVFVVYVLAIIAIWTPVEIAFAVNLQDLESQINSIGREAVQAAWNRHGITSDLFHSMSPPQARRLSLEPKPKTNDLGVLEVTDDWDWQYLIFRRDGQDWSYEGNIDLPNQKHHPPAFRLALLKDGQLWFVVDYMLGSGTGIVQYEQSWYDFSKKGVPTVLKFPTKGHVMGWGVPFDRGYESKVLRANEISGKYIIEIQIDANYSEGSSFVANPGPFFGLSRKARYVWDQKAARFRIDPQASTISEDQIWGIVNDGPVEFLVHNYNELVKLVKGKDGNKRLWVARFLETCKDAPQRRDLLRLFDKSMY